MFMFGDLHYVGLILFLMNNCIPFSSVIVIYYRLYLPLWINKMVNINALIQNLQKDTWIFYLRAYCIRINNYYTSKCVYYV